MTELVHAPTTVKSQPPRIRKAPGVYEDVPFSEYVLIDAVNHSTLRHMRRSPAHFKHALDDATDSGETPSKAFGVAGHALILEPARFAKDVVRGPVNERTNKCYGRDTKAWAEFAAQHVGKLILTDDEIERLRGVAKAFAKHSKAPMLMAPGGMSEVVIVWDEGGILCKARLDRLFPTVGAFDIKTCESAEAFVLERALVEYHYHTQDAFYKRGLRKLGIPPVMTFVALESEPPHGVSIFQVDDDTHKAADALIEAWLHRVKRCREAQSWPSYPEDVLQLSAPKWWLSQFADGI